MNKNIKRMFFVTALIILLVSIPSLSATDASNDTSTMTQQDVIKEVNVEKISNTPVTDTSSKNIKKDETTTNLYVSDTSGSDDNSGTNTSPFKTIQKALDKTTSEGTYNIHILEGTYKGLGNTNLTVNGNNTINLIGTGINSTILDGEATYVIDPNPGYVWDSTEMWYPYINDSGNYAMTITPGNGHISISNLNISHMWCPGGDRIDLYEHSPVDNYGNLSINYVEFYYNCGGVGSAIRNNEGATLLINNSQFELNRKSSSTGNDGILYNIGVATVLNTVFDHNWARWGTILNDKNITVVNTTFSNNIAYDGASTYKYGAGFAFNSGDADFFNPAGYTTFNNVTNCTFINNGQTDIYGTGTLNATNNQFINSTGIRITGGNCLIVNNTISGTIPSTISSSLSSGSSTFSIFSNANKIVIEKNTIEMDNGVGIYIKTGTVTNNKIIIKNQSTSLVLNNGNNSYITNNAVNQPMNITANNTYIQNNTITTTDDYTIYLKSNPRNVTITDNYLKARFYIGDLSVRNPRNNIVENNTPKASDNIYVRNNIHEADEGSMNKPTTLVDAISKVEDGKNIVLINGEYNITDTIIISDETTLPDTHSFNIIGLTDAITNDAKTTIINGQKTQILKILSGYNIQIENITFTNAEATNGGAIYTESNLTIENSEFMDNTADIGAAIYAIGDIKIILNNNTFINNTAEVETIYLNQITDKTIINNKYNNNSILTTTTIEFINQDTTHIEINEETSINITEIQLTNPEYYDNNITKLPLYEYVNDELVNILEDTMHYNISANVPTTLNTYIIPTFTTDKSNILSVDVKTSGLDVNITIPMTTGFINETTDVIITITDENNLPVQKGTVKVYENNTLLSTINVENGKATYTTDILEKTGLIELFIEYEDQTETYNTANQTINLIIFNHIYVAPNITGNHSGLIDDPTSIEDALTKIHDNKTIILLDGTYKLSKTITINNNNAKAKTFNITNTNNNAILDGQNKKRIMTINSGYNLTFNNVTFANAKSSDGAIYSRYNSIELNNCKFVNNTLSDMTTFNTEFNTGGGISTSYSNITITDSIFENNSAAWGGAI